MGQSDHDEGQAQKASIAFPALPKCRMQKRCDTRRAKQDLRGVIQRKQSERFQIIEEK